MAKRNALGRGLGALINENSSDSNSSSDRSAKPAGIKEIAINDIVVNPYQPRTEFDTDKLYELSQSIDKLGIIQPITVRQLSSGMYQIIAGERRFRASKLANKSTIPAWIRESDDEGMLELALVENIQRVDLNAIEVALSYKRLIDECNLKQEELGSRVGKNRTTVTNYLRLLKLPELIQKGLKERVISMGHARALINIECDEDKNMIFEQIVKHDLSVRKVEEIVREFDSKDKDNKKEKKTASIYDALEQHLGKYFDTKVSFKINKSGKGSITIPFENSSKLEQIIDVFDSIKSK